MAEEGLPLDQAFHNLLVLDDPVPAAAERNEEQNSEPGSESDSEEEEQPEDAREGELIPQPEEEPPETREDFLQYFHLLTLDPNTAHRNLHLSEGNRVVTRGGENEARPYHPDRFDHWNQVLCREVLPERCYWEAEWDGDGVYIAVTDRNIIRKGRGNDAALGWNEKSWALRCSRFSFWHNNLGDNNIHTCPSKIGVYRDHRAGTLSFYSVSDTMTLLYRVQTAFTELYAGFWLQNDRSFVILCDRV